MSTVCKSCRKSYDTNNSKCFSWSDKQKYCSDSCKRRGESNSSGSSSSSYDYGCDD